MPTSSSIATGTPRGTSTSSSRQTVCWFWPSWRRDRAPWLSWRRLLSFLSCSSGVLESKMEWMIVPPTAAACCALRKQRYGEAARRCFVVERVALDELVDTVALSMYNFSVPAWPPMKMKLHPTAIHGQRVLLRHPASVRVLSFSLKCSNLEHSEMLQVGRCADVETGHSPLVASRRLLSTVPHLTSSNQRRSHHMMIDRPMLTFA